LEERRRPARHQGSPDAGTSGWLALDDDELLYRIEATPRGPDTDSPLIEVVCSDRHFFIRQEAAKRITDVALLKAHAGDRHIGQILVRGMTRGEDTDYLERLASETRHLEVRKAAEAQLRRIAAFKAREPE